MPYLRQKVNDAKLPNFDCKGKHMNTHHHHHPYMKRKRTSGKEREEKT
jgi:hypothetical protein